jgi:hypothetical protein
MCFCGLNGACRTESRAESAVLRLEEGHTFILLRPAVIMCKAWRSAVKIPGRVSGQYPVVVSLKFGEAQKQILRLTTPELKSVRGPFRSE